MCPHQPTCPSAFAPDHDAAHAVASHPEQGWSLLCNGVVVFDDTGEILPDGTVVGPCGRALAAPAPPDSRAQQRRRPMVRAALS